MGEGGITLGGGGNIGGRGDNIGGGGNKNLVTLTDQCFIALKGDKTFSVELAELGSRQFLTRDNDDATTC